MFIGGKMEKNKNYGSVKLTKTCRYCGSNDRIFNFEDGAFNRKICVVCNDCKFRTRRYTKAVDAIKEWNSRDED